MIGGLGAVVACSDATNPDGDTIVASIAPDGGATDVDPAGPIALTFSGPMRAGMEDYIAMHRGEVAGPVVPGSWAWSDNRTRLSFTPTSPLDPGTAYTIHLGGGMMDAGGRALGYEHCLDQHGGRWATDQMMGANGGMMGSGWQHANGTYGMTFTFTTR
jgi:hypothetical protein